MSGSVRFHRWTGDDDLDLGDHDGTGVLDGALVLARPRGVREYDDTHRDAPPEKYEFATWT